MGKQNKVQYSFVDRFLCAKQGVLVFKFCLIILIFQKRVARETTCPAGRWQSFPDLLQHIQIINSSVSKWTSSDTWVTAWQLFLLWATALQWIVGSSESPRGHCVASTSKTGTAIWYRTMSKGSQCLPRTFMDLTKIPLFLLMKAGLSRYRCRNVSDFHHWKLLRKEGDFYLLAQSFGGSWFKTGGSFSFDIWSMRWKMEFMCREGHTWTKEQGGREHAPV